MISKKLHTTRNPIQWVVLLSALQVLCATFFLKMERFHYLNSILFFACGIALSLVLLRAPEVKFHKGLFFHRASLKRLVFLLPFLTISYFLARKIMDGTPLQIEHADMLPVMNVMAQRFLNGNWSTVYDPIPEIWNGMQPVYLPALWMPFVFAEVFDFDMRWITVSGIWLSVVLCVLPGKQKGQPLSAVYVLSLFVLLIWLHTEGTNNVIRLTEEGVVIFYYSLMAVALFVSNPYLIGISAALCFLSRYAIIGWVPFAILYLMARKEYRFLIKAALSGVFTAAILLSPFGIKPLQLHLTQHKLYMLQAERVWQTAPHYFYQSPGLAKFFGSGGVLILHIVLTAGSFIIPAAFFLLIRKKPVASNMALLSGFQLSITFFYAFIDVSYLYLYYTPVFVSLVVAGWLAASGDGGLGNQHSRAQHELFQKPMP